MKLSLRFPNDTLTPKRKIIKKHVPVYINEGDFRGCAGYIYKYVGDGYYLIILDSRKLNGNKHPFGDTLRASRRSLGYVG